jgi:hypothetical protein
MLERVLMPEQHSPTRFEILKDQIERCLGDPGGNGFDLHGLRLDPRPARLRMIQYQGGLVYDHGEKEQLRTIPLDTALKAPQRLVRSSYRPVRLGGGQSEGWSESAGWQIGVGLWTRIENYYIFAFVTTGFWLWLFTECRTITELSE